MNGRRSRRDVLAAAGAAGAAALLAGCGGSDKPSAAPAPAATTTPQPKSYAGPPDGKGVAVGVLVEEILAGFYSGLASDGGLRGRDRELAKRIAAEEREHLEALETLLDQLRGERLKRPPLELDRLLAGGRAEILGRAAELEDLAAAAYLGQLPHLRYEEIRATMLSVAAVETRHAVALGSRAGRPLAPAGALPAPLTPDELVARIAELGT